MTRLGYMPDASRSEQVRWMVSRCEPLLLVSVSVHYLLRTSVWTDSTPVVIAAIVGCALGLFGLVYDPRSRLGLVRAIVEPAERRRRSVNRGRVALDVLEELKLGVLEGKLDGATLGRLKAAQALPRHRAHHRRDERGHVWLRQRPKPQNLAAATHDRRSDLLYLRPVRCGPGRPDQQ